MIWVTVRDYTSHLIMEEAKQNIPLLNFKGCYFPLNIIKPEHLEAIEDFEVRESDIFIITYHKSGTIWFQNILCLILYEGYRNGTENISLSTQAPFLDYNIQNVDIAQLPSPRVILSHLPYYLASKELRAKRGKVIYVYRNPKDVMVSYFHYINSIKGIEKSDLEPFMQNFLSGKVPSSLIFDHVKGWYTHQDEFNILILCYEEAVQDLKGTVLQICKFIGKELSSQEVDKVVEMSTFKNMKTDPRVNCVKYYEQHFGIKNMQHLRKGIVGDWKNTMTVAQSERFDHVFKERMEKLPFEFCWDIQEDPKPISTSVEGSNV